MSDHPLDLDSLLDSSRLPALVDSVHARCGRLLYDIACARSVSRSPTDADWYAAVVTASDTDRLRAQDIEDVYQRDGRLWRNRKYIHITPWWLDCDDRAYVPRPYVAKSHRLRRAADVRVSHRAPDSSLCVTEASYELSAVDTELDLFPVERLFPWCSQYRRLWRSTKYIHISLRRLEVDDRTNAPRACVDPHRLRKADTVCERLRLPPDTPLLPDVAARDSAAARRRTTDCARVVRGTGAGW